jgi:exopolyphosphatase/guanosine-5'-triphosphate,3'-diphosphate pyrophosphatase
VRLAAIDLGSNSVHMVVAEVSPDGRIAVVDRVKEMVRLGRRAFTTGKLTADTMELAERAMTTFGRLARARHVKRLRVVATSAVREARNGAAFVRRLRRATGLPVDVISGLDEAHLIFRAVRHAMDLTGGPYLLVDVGGGSVELALVADGRPLWIRSVPLGVARLSERFLPNDPPTGRNVRALERHIERTIGDLLDRARRRGVVAAIGTSGTVNTLVAMARVERGEDTGRLHGASATREELQQIRRRVLALDAWSRAELPGMDAKRVDLIPAAAVLLDVILARARVPYLTVCGWALREGVLLELAGVNGGGAGTTAGRRRSVMALGRRYAGDNAHGRQVAWLATELFDATAGTLGLPAGGRELLEHAALLHDIGHAVDHDRHQRHSYYLIRNSELLGFDPDEIEVIALVARGHRKQAPKPSDPEVQSLPGSKRKLVRGLAALLRIADALDRTHFGVVKSLHIAKAAGRFVIEVDAGAENAELELWAAERRIDLLSRLLDRPVVLRVATTSRPRAVVRRASWRATAGRAGSSPRRIRTGAG